MRSPLPSLFKEQSPVHGNLPGYQHPRLGDQGFGFYLYQSSHRKLEAEGCLTLYLGAIITYDANKLFSTPMEIVTPNLSRLCKIYEFSTSLVNDDDTIESLIKRADALLYKSKTAGRNRLTEG